ncbi:MAG: decaprenyl-phosphate phosphoribosyltransferase [Candidatus Omnitrophica bacterium]|nr:decaprenyl-phosphate phosphoribosyltransferase [Candidatus Omnitrophota bacterium]
MSESELNVLDPVLETAPPARRAARGWGRLRALGAALRPAQWVKNLFVLTPLFFSQGLRDPGSVWRAAAATGLFCLMSSSIYLLNDLRDRETDRRHPHKRLRPLASGALSGWEAQLALAGLLAVSMAAAWTFSPALATVLAVYWVLNLAYSIRLKHVVILDVFTIAAGYLLRVVGGAVVIGVAMSSWLLICTTLLALFIGLCKRRHEQVFLEGGAEGHRQVLAEYPLAFLDMMIGALTAAALVSYTLYAASEEMARKAGSSSGMLLTVPFVLYGFFRYLYLVYRKEEGGDPTQSVLTDRPMLVNLVLWAAAAAAVLYQGGRP